MLQIAVELLSRQLPEEAPEVVLVHEEAVAGKHTDAEIRIREVGIEGDQDLALLFLLLLFAPGAVFLQGNAVGRIREAEILSIGLWTVRAPGIPRREQGADPLEKISLDALIVARIAHLQRCEVELEEDRRIVVGAVDRRIVEDHIRGNLAAEEVIVQEAYALFDLPHMEEEADFLIERRQLLHTACAAEGGGDALCLVRIDGVQHTVRREAVCMRQRMDEEDRLILGEGDGIHPVCTEHLLQDILECGGLRRIEIAAAAPEGEQHELRPQHPKLAGSSFQLLRTLPAIQQRIPENLLHRDRTQLDGLIQCLRLMPALLQLEDRLFHGFDDLFLIHRLQNVVADTEFHRLTRKLILAIAGEHDDLTLALRLLQLPDHPDAIEQRHLDVREDQIRLLPAGHLEALFAVFCSADELDLMLLPGNQAGHAFTLELLIINQQQSIHLCSPFLSFSSAAGS